MKNLVIAAFGGKQALYKEYKLLSPKTVNRILDEIEYTGEINRNLNRVINALGTARNKKTNKLSNLMGKMALKKPTYKRPTAKKPSLSNMFGKLSVKKTITKK